MRINLNLEKKMECLFYTAKSNLMFAYMYVCIRLYYILSQSGKATRAIRIILKQ